MPWQGFLLALNANAKEAVTAYSKPGAEDAMPGPTLPVRGYGYFVTDRVDSTPGKPVFNRVVTLKDSSRFETLSSCWSTQLLRVVQG
jgi:glutaminyl-tRNA synthetase